MAIQETRRKDSQKAVETGLTYRHLGMPKFPQNPTFFFTEW